MSRIFWNTGTTLWGIIESVNEELLKSQDFPKKFSTVSQNNVKNFLLFHIPFR